MLIEQGVNIRVVQEVLGHTRVTTHRALHPRGRRLGPGRGQPDGRRAMGRGLTATGTVQSPKTIKGLPATFIGKALISGRRLGDLNPRMDE
jgi:hypothetical protein